MKQPMLVTRSRFRGAPPKGVQCRLDVEQCEMTKYVAVIQCKSVCDARSTVMSDEPQLVVTKSVHQFADVLSHSSLAVVTHRFVRPAISAQIRSHDMEVFSQGWHDVAPAQ